MPVAFDPGPVHEPFATLVREAPGEEAYPPASFRTEWGPIFHRGRLDGSARLLVVGQDPAQSENVCRRILVGTAGRRVQAFMARLGITRSYVMVNVFLFSVAPGSPPLRDLAEEPAIAAYRNRWLDALAGDGGIEAVMTFGTLARRAFAAWRETPAGQAADVVHAWGTHPTAAWHEPEGPRREAAERRLVEGWNEALERLHGAVTPDEPRALERYDPVSPAGEAEIPAEDLPAGTPAWMRSREPWAVRDGRESIVVTVPEAARGW